MWLAAKGKKALEGPEARQGRRGLFDVLQQSSNPYKDGARPAWGCLGGLPGCSRFLLGASLPGWGLVQLADCVRVGGVDRVGGVGGMNAAARLDGTALAAAHLHLQASTLAQ